MICEYCSGSGFYIGYGGYIQDLTTGNYYQGGCGIYVKCKACNGTGYFNEDEEITVPKKYVKEEYWRN